MGRHINQERLAEYVAMYTRGMSTREIGRTFGLSGQAVHDTLKRAGVALRTRPTCPVVVEYKGLRFSPEKDGYLRCTRGGTREAGGAIFLHRLIWEEHHGEIPDNHLIVFRDGDRANCKIENLECISVAEAQRRRRKMPADKPCEACGTVFGPHRYYYESPSAFAARKCCSFSCSRSLLRGVPKGSTVRKRPRYRKPRSIDHRSRVILDLRARSSHQDPRHHMGLIYREAGKLGHAFGCETGEFLGAAYIAMTDAIRTWDADKGHRFSTHAVTALKFRTYRAAMEDRGRRRTGKDGWKDPLSTQRLTNAEGAQIDVAARDDGESQLKSRESEKARQLNELLAIAAEVSPECGEEAIRMMARGVSDIDVGPMLGRAPGFARWLKWKIGLKVTGDVEVGA